MVKLMQTDYFLRSSLVGVTRAGLSVRRLVGEEHQTRAASVGLKYQNIHPSITAAFLKCYFTQRSQRKKYKAAKRKFSGYARGILNTIGNAGPKHVNT